VTPPRGSSASGRGRGPQRTPRANVPQRRRSRRRARVSRRRRVPLLILATFVGLVALLAVAGFGGAAYVFSNCKLSDLKSPGTNSNSFIYAANGSLLGSIPAEENREAVKRSQMSPWLAKATVAIEDRRFYHHGGIDPRGIMRAFWKDVTAGKVVEGGSTITQQLVRNLYLSQEQTTDRKVKEICLANKLAGVWTKERILTEYMNQVYYGSHAYGVEAAAQTYFSKPAKELTLSQAALLAGLPQAPSDYDPFLNQRVAIERRNEVLAAMLRNHDVTPRQYAVATTAKVKLKAGTLYTRIREPYFFSYVRDELIAQYGAATVRTGGLRVYTTIDPRLQRAAERAVRDTLPYTTDPAAAVVSIDPRNGAIRAMTAVTPGKKGNQFNLVAQARRQAGSTFKTFVLAAAIAQGINPETSTYVSAPFHYQPYPDSAPWDVHTYDSSYTGPTTIERALLRSDNSVFAQLTVDVGPANVAAMARRLGVRTSKLDDNGAFVPSIGLGAMPVSPLEMASAYATLAAGGIYSKPISILRVRLASGAIDKDSGWGKPDRVRVIDDGVAAEVTKILGENIHYGTAVAADIGRPDAAKTGTTENHADAWLCGYTPNLSTTVWMGYPQAEIPMLSVHGVSVTGGSFPAQIWHLYMESALANVRPFDFLQPKHLPVYKPFVRGDYAIAGGYYPTTTSSTSSTTTDIATTGEAPTTDVATTAPATTTDEAPPVITDTAPVVTEPAPTDTTTFTDTVATG
jgi:penicillin-binding protein 1A